MRRFAAQVWTLDRLRSARRAVASTGAEDERHRHILPKQPDRQLHRQVMFELHTTVRKLRGHRHLHAHFPDHLRHPVHGGGHRQRAGHLRGDGMQEENGLGHLRLESGDSRHAVFAGDALQHPPAGARQAVGLWKLYVQSGGGGGRQQPVHHSGNCYRAVH